MMALLLGSQACIESLQQDASDLDSALVEVISRVGPLSCPSWKFPDKLSIDVDTSELLKKYSFCGDDPESNQLAHSVLLELVIDRFVALLHGLAAFVDSFLQTNRVASAKSPRMKGSSVGTEVRRFWRRMLQLHLTIQQLVSENKTKARKLAAVAEPSSPINLSDTASLGGDSVHHDVKHKNQAISSDIFTKSCQTMETAFVPCDSCDRVQACLRQTGAAVMAVCRSRELPSALERYRSMSGDQLNWLSSVDVCQWTTEQNKDMYRVCKHMEELASAVDPLKSQLSMQDARCKELQKKLDESKKSLNLAKEDHFVECANLKAEWRERHAKAEEVIERLCKEKENLACRKDQLESNLDGFRSHCKQLTQQIDDLQLDKQKLEEELGMQVRTSKEISILQEELDRVNEQAKWTKKELTKEQCKTEGLKKQLDSTENKQDALLERLSSLHAENVSLTEHVQELEDSKLDLLKTVDKLRMKEEKLKVSLRHHEDDIESVHESNKRIEELEEELDALKQELAKAAEEKRLLAEYPDLSGPVSRSEGTGDIMLDMQNQMESNDLRIFLLQEQNSKFSNALLKLGHVGPHVQSGNYSNNNNAMADDSQQCKIRPGTVTLRKGATQLGQDSNSNVQTDFSPFAGDAIIATEGRNKAEKVHFDGPAEQEQPSFQRLRLPSVDEGPSGTHFVNSAVNPSSMEEQQEIYVPAGVPINDYVPQRARQPKFAFEEATRAYHQHWASSTARSPQAWLEENPQSVYNETASDRKYTGNLLPVSKPKTAPEKSAQPGQRQPEVRSRTATKKSRVPPASNHVQRPTNENAVGMTTITTPHLANLETESSIAAFRQARKLGLLRPPLPKHATARKERVSVNVEGVLPCPKCERTFQNVRELTVHAARCRPHDGTT